MLNVQGVRWWKLPGKPHQYKEWAALLCDVVCVCMCVWVCVGVCVCVVWHPGSQYLAYAALNSAKPVHICVGGCCSLSNQTER